MTKRSAGVLLPLALLAAASCGKKGPILPPFVRVPQVVQEVRLSRIGDTVGLSWTDPSAYIDGNPLPGLSEVEVWVIEQPAGDGPPAARPEAKDFEKKGRLLKKVSIALPMTTGAEPPPPRPEAVSLEPGPDVLARNFMFFSLRARDGKRRASDFSEPAVLEPGTALPPPVGLKAALYEDRIELVWTPPPASGGAGGPQIAGYNVYRSEGDLPPLRLKTVPAGSPEFHDPDFSFGKVYVYFVRSAGAGTLVSVESRNSEPARAEPVDVFPPAAPRGLTTISGEGFIALSWEPAAETDLAGYRVWRRAAGEPEFVLLKEMSPAESAYTDAAVAGAGPYAYAVTAFDRAGNESGRSAEAAGRARRTPS